MILEYVLTTRRTMVVGAFIPMSISALDLLMDEWFLTSNEVSILLRNIHRVTK